MSRSKFASVRPAGRDLVTTAADIAAAFHATFGTHLDPDAPSDPRPDDRRIDEYQDWRDGGVSDAESERRQRVVDAELSERWGRQ